MVKREDSIRSLGQVLIATDKPTRAKLKVVAAAAGMPLTEYLRLVADRGLQDTRGVLPGDNQASPMTRVASILKTMDAKLDAVIAPKGHRSFTADAKALDASFWHALGLESTEENIEFIREAIKEYRERHSGQLGISEGFKEA